MGFHCVAWTISIRQFTALRGRFLSATSLRCVDDTGIEPVTPTMSMWCSTAEPIVLGIYEVMSEFIALAIDFFLEKTNGGRNGI